MDIHPIAVAGEVGAQAFINLSTRDAKTDIEYLTPEARSEALFKVKSLKLATYHYTDEASSSPLRLGLIAEEAPADILSIDGKGVDLYKLSALTLAGVQELSQKVTALESILGISLADLATTTATGTEGRGLVAIVLDALDSLGVTIRDGFASFAKIFAEDLTVGSAEKPTGITLFDENGTPHCVRVSASGELRQTEGECGVEPAPVPAPEPTPEPVFEQPAGTGPESITDTQPAGESTTPPEEQLPIEQSAPVQAETVEAPAEEFTPVQAVSPEPAPEAGV